ncbi:THUMP domain-containing class I SAM-dependent RNA methyltransferase [Pararhodobacter zhoushanensis]|uniref:THUMP domain-containing class I SAM-dependent RNA methyltransferase n=1 Tax=Pararhodobacter zhoushanensis TaxID=2479545 RepID=UPI000F8DB9E5|nr:class I SAM-dependent RNA methyltransferase [Pararhodobacter zhoushanensis]
MIDTLFLTAVPGLEATLADEARAAGFKGVTVVPGGVEAKGGWPEVWRANLVLRGTTRVLVRIASFRAMHLAQLDKRSRKVDWAGVLRADLPVRVETTCRQSKIYHAKAATQRIETAIREELGAPIVPAAAEAAIVVKARIEDDLVTISLDTSGESLHKRGHKEAVGKAPMRETLAALILRQMGFDGSQTVVDPMCGSGTFAIEAAEIAAGLQPGRDRAFAFQQLASYDPAGFAALKGTPAVTPVLRFFGSDRDQGAVGGARANAARAGVSDWCQFDRKPISDLTPPEGAAPGLVLVNPPWGARIGERKLLFALYGSLGRVLGEGFAGWRLGLVSPDAGLVKATGLPLKPLGAPIDMGGTKVVLWEGTIPSH